MNRVSWTAILIIATLSPSCGRHKYSKAKEDNNPASALTKIQGQLRMLRSEWKDWLSCFRASAIIEGNLSASQSLFMESPEQYVIMRMDVARDLISGLEIPALDFRVFNATDEAWIALGKMRYYPTAEKILSANGRRCVAFLEGDVLLRCLDGKFHALLGPNDISELRLKLEAFLELMNFDAFELARLAESRDSRVDQILQRLDVPSASQVLAQACASELSCLGEAGMPGMVFCMVSILQNSIPNRRLSHFPPGFTREIFDTYMVLTRACEKIMELPMNSEQSNPARIRLLRLAAAYILGKDLQ